MILTWLKLRYLRLMQDRLIFKPIHKQIFTTCAPETYDLPHTKDVSITTSDDVTLHLWHHKTEAEDAPTIILFHGNTGSWVDVGKPRPHETYDRTYRLSLLRNIIAQKVNFIAVSMRGYGKSERHPPSETDFAHDLEAVAKYAIYEAGVNPDNIILLGESLGGAIAMIMAEHMTKAGTPPRLVSTIAVFSSMAKRVTDDHPDLTIEQIEHSLRHDFNTNKSADALSEKTALLLFHGNEDDTTHHYHSEILHASATESNLVTKLETMDGVGHINWDAEFIIKETLDYYDKL
jgi:dipeptidyl aminopeptidase/acylaminoacyl peptidase